MNKPPFAHSCAAITRHPAPVREHYFTGRDYAAACMRICEKRVRHDKGVGGVPTAWKRPRKIKKDAAPKIPDPCR